MFVNKTRRIVDCIVDDEVEVLFRRVVCDLGVGDFFGC
jgi:putative transposon-encoded protein